MSLINKDKVSLQIFNCPNSQDHAKQEATVLCYLSHQRFSLVAVSLETEAAPSSRQSGVVPEGEVSPNVPGSHPVWSELSEGLHP